MSQNARNNSNNNKPAAGTSSSYDEQETRTITSNRRHNTNILITITLLSIVVCASFIASLNSSNQLSEVYKALREESIDYNHQESSMQEQERQKLQLHNRHRRQNTTTSASGAKKEERHDDMNIVLLYADDWTYRSLGLINKHVHTPNINELARNGIMFTRNCVTTSICWQSRATMVTGTYTAVHQQTHIGSDNMFNKTVQWSQTLYPLLKSNNYHVGYYGKWHAPMEHNFEIDAFDEYDNYYGEHIMERDGKRRHVTELNGEDAINYLRHKRPRNNDNNNTTSSNNKDPKFALTISFFATHSWDGNPYPNQYVPQNYTRNLYSSKTRIPQPTTSTQRHWNDMPWFFTEDNEARIRYFERYDTYERYQDTMKKYYRMVKEVDDVVGAIVQELKDQNLYNNTLIVFTTDNGMFHGEHQLAGKWYPHEESIRVPLIIQDPRMPHHVRGTTNDDFTLNIDLAPFLLSAACIPVPSYMQGCDIANLYLHDNGNNNNNNNNNDYQNDNGKQQQQKQQVERSRMNSKEWREDFFYEWTQGSPADGTGHNVYTHIPAVFGLISKKYKYFYWPQVKYEQVFHVREDPLEENDVFNSTLENDPSIIAELRGRYAYLKSLSQSGQPV